jgi:hypothetical protein
MATVQEITAEMQKRGYDTPSQMSAWSLLDEIIDICKELNRNKVMVKKFREIEE